MVILKEKMPYFIELTSTNGQTVSVNIDQIVSVSEVTGNIYRIFLTDGNDLSVTNENLLSILQQFND